MPDELAELWFATGSRDYFAIPEGTPFPPGDLMLRGLRGQRERGVDREWAARWAIPREEARRRLQEDAARAVVGAREALSRLSEHGFKVPQLEAAREALGSEAVTGAVRDLGRKIDDLLGSPEVERAVDRLGQGLSLLARRLREPMVEPRAPSATETSKDKRR
jgi:hypothetical protein